MLTIDLILWINNEQYWSVICAGLIKIGEPLLWCKSKFCCDQLANFVNISHVNEVDNRLFIDAKHRCNLLMKINKTIRGLLFVSLAFSVPVTACSDGRFHASGDMKFIRPIPLPEGIKISTPRVLELKDKQFSYDVMIEAEYPIEELAVKVTPGPGVIPNEASFGVFEDQTQLTVTGKALANVMTVTSVQVIGVYQGEPFNAYRFVTAKPVK
ncbi:MULTISPECIES: hypothetical protein [Vibrio]|uniref:hypothetical protein n=1 Tax=Vibrio TaxID=662 RepID=UPI0011D28210|nr:MULTISPECIES: hypothetical protein [Vibrio]